MNGPLLASGRVLAVAAVLFASRVRAFDEPSVISGPVPAPTESDEELSPDEWRDEELDALLELDISELQHIEVRPSRVSGGLGSDEVQGAGRQVAAASASASIISGAESAFRNTTDAGALLGRSSSSPGVYLQQRSPIISDPRIRGYRFG